MYGGGSITKTYPILSSWVTQPCKYGLAHPAPTVTGQATEAMSSCLAFPASVQQEARQDFGREEERCSGIKDTHPAISLAIPPLFRGQKWGQVGAGGLFRVAQLNSAHLLKTNLPESQIAEDQCTKCPFSQIDKIPQNFH